MLGAVVGVLTKVGTWAAAVKGAQVVVAGAKKVTTERFPKHAPVVAGTGDFLMNVLDPFDIFGTRKAKEDEQARRMQAAQNSAKEKEKLARDEAKKAKEAEKGRRAAEAKARKAEQKALNAQKKAQLAEKKGQNAQAMRLRKEAQSAQRWARMSRRMAEKSAQAGSVDQQLAIAMAAVQLANQAQNPPMSAAEALLQEGSAAGQNLMVTLTDAINRDEEPNYDALADRLNANDPTAFESVMNEAMYDMDMEGPVEGAECEGEHCPGNPHAEEGTVVAGSCCTACAYGSTCAGKTKFVPAGMIDGGVAGEDLYGDDDDAGFGGFFTSGDFDGDDEMFAMVAGPELMSERDVLVDPDVSNDTEDGFGYYAGEDCPDGMCTPWFADLEKVPQ